MATPIIQSAQPSGAGTGTAGEGRDDLETGDVVNLSDTEAANSGATYAWSLLSKPYDSAAALTGSNTATPSFTPDVTGSYAIECVVTVGSRVYRDVEVLRVPLPNSGQSVPCFGEGTEYDEDGNAQGYAPLMTDFMRWCDTNVGSLGDDIAAEAIARAAADTTEATARAAADTTEATARAAAITTEATARAAADTTLTTNVATNTTNVATNTTNIATNTSNIATLTTANGHAFHDNVTGEVNALTAKSKPTKTDKYLGENAANSHSKIYTTLEDFVASAGGPWVRPDSPSAYDDEFDADTSANWTFSPSAVATAIAPYSTIVTNPRVDWGVARRSHLSLQPPDATNAHMARAISLATDCWVHARFNWTHSYVTLSGTVMQWFGLVLSEQGDLAGHYLEMSSGALFAASAKTLRSRAKDAGGTAEIQNIAFSPGAGIPYNHVAIQKISSTYYFYGANDRGEIRYCGSKVWAGNTLDTLVLYFFDDGGAVGSSICFVDFVRYGSGQKWPLL